MRPTAGSCHLLSEVLIFYIICMYPFSSITIQFVLNVADLVFFLVKKVFADSSLAVETYDTLFQDKNLKFLA